MLQSLGIDKRGTHGIVEIGIYVFALLDVIVYLLGLVVQKVALVGLAVVALRAVEAQVHNAVSHHLEPSFAGGAFIVQHQAGAILIQQVKCLIVVLAGVAKLHRLAPLARGVGRRQRLQQGTNCVELANGGAGRELNEQSSLFGAQLPGSLQKANNTGEVIGQRLGVRNIAPQLEGKGKLRAGSWKALHTDYTHSL
nr:hypothetical protein [Hymenobacter rigui]